MEVSRKAFEILRKNTFIFPYYIDSGQSDEAAKALAEAMNGFYKYSSKFVHETTLDGSKLKPKEYPKAKDANLVYFIIAGAINSLAKRRSKQK